MLFRYRHVACSIAHISEFWRRSLTSSVHFCFAHLAHDHINSPRESIAYLRDGTPLCITATDGQPCPLDSMVFSIDGLPSCIVSQTGKPCASEYIVYAADGPYCNDDSTATPPPADSVQFRFPSLVTPASGDMCTGISRGPRCKPEAECWPDQDEQWYGPLKSNETYSDYAYMSYLVLDGTKCENAEVNQPTCLNQ
jgi:hypothetical protein